MYILEYWIDIINVFVLFHITNKLLWYNILHYFQVHSVPKLNVMRNHARMEESASSLKQVSFACVQINDLEAKDVIEGWTLAMIFSNRVVETGSVTKMKNHKKPDLGIGANVISGGVVIIKMQLENIIMIRR